MTKNNNIKDQSICHGRKRTQKSSILKRIFQREIGRKKIVTQNLLQRGKIKLEKVLQREECAIVLGFSSDGNYLMYYSSWEAVYEVSWKKFHAERPAHPVIADSPALKLLVGPINAISYQHSLDGALSLQIHQSLDENLVIAVAADRHLSSHDTQRFYISIAPSPVFDGGMAREVMYLRFAFFLLSPSSSVSSWKLLRRIQDQFAYIIALNMGSSIAILHIQLRSDRMTHIETQEPLDDVRHDQESKEIWYDDPEFPVEFTKEYFLRHTKDIGDKFPRTVGIECVSQRVFDAEKFFEKLMEKYPVFRHLKLIDYDLQLVDVLEQEEVILLSCVMDFIASSKVTKLPRRLAIYFSLNIHNGETNLIRVLKMPGTQELRLISHSMAKKYANELKSRVPILQTTEYMWSNESVDKEKSLSALHNPRLPFSIYLE